MTNLEKSLSSLRHLYSQMVGGLVKDSAQVKRIAEGILSPAIANLEKAARRAPAAPVPQGWSLHEAARDALEWMDDDDLSMTHNIRERLRQALEAAPQPPEVGCSVSNGETQAAPVQMPEYGIDTANHAGIRVRGYTEQQVRELLETQASVSNGTLPSQPTFKTEDGEKAREPLTVDQACALYENWDYGLLDDEAYSIIRQVERAHGIGVEKP